MPLPLASELRFGFITTVATAGEARASGALADRLEYDSIWTGDHLSFPVPIFDPLLQLAQLAMATERATLGTSVYLLPLRHPTPVAKQVATLDHLSGGRLIFGVGVGGEFPLEYEAAGVPVEERGARLGEGIRLLRSLWTGDAAAFDGRFYPVPALRMLPAPIQAGGPPIWCGGRSDAALRRMGRLADGWLAYVVTPDQYREGLETIARAAEEAGRSVESFGTGHLLFTRIDSSYEAALETASAHLSRRYAMDFRRATERYAAIGRPEDVAERIAALRDAGLRHVIVDPTGPLGDREDQLEAFAKSVRPLL